MNKEHHIEVISKITDNDKNELKELAKHLIETDEIHEAYLITKTMNDLVLINMMIKDFLDDDFLQTNELENIEEI